MQESIISLFAFASVAMAATYSINVGGNGLTFVRNNLHAQVGDEVEFIFNGKHSVAQSTYDNPCVPSDHSPIFSGVITGPSADTNDPMPHWTMPLLTNETLWLYCSVEDHCQKGMSMSIVVGNNPDADQTLEKYQAAAANVAVASAPTTTIGGTLVLPSATGVASGSAYGTGIAPGNSTAVTSKGSTVTATKSGSASGSASATSSGTAVTASGAAGQAKVPVALGFAGIAGGLAAFMI